MKQKFCSIRVISSFVLFVFQRYFVVSLILLLVATISNAAPSIIGGRGLFRVEDARSEDLGVIAVSSYILSHKDTSNGYVGDIVAPNILYSPTNFLDLFFWTGRVVTNSKFSFPKFWENELTTVKHDMVVGGKVCLPIPILKLGAKLTYSWARDNIDGVSSIKPTDGFSWVGLATLNLSDRHSSLPNLIVNYSESSTERDYGAGVEISGSGGTIFVEGSSSESTSVSMFDNILDNVTVTPGLRINLGGHSSIAGGVILNVKKKPEIPDYTAIFGLTIGGALLKPPQPKIGILTGTITDANTGNSLIGTISFLEKPKLKPIQSNVQTGIFKVMKIPAGVLIVEVNCEGYQKMTTAISVEANKVNAYDFKLKPLITYGTVAGNVYDASNKKPLEVSLTLNNNLIREVKTDSVTGAFKIEKFETGVLTIEAKKDGYFPKAVTVSVEEGKVTQVDFPLVSSVFRGYFIGRVIDKTTATPLKASITFPNTNLSPLVSDSLTGTFQTEMPVGTYPILVSAEEFLTQTSFITIEKDKTTESIFELNPVKEKTIMTGKVSDKKTGNALQSIISFPEVGIEPIKTDSITGVYRTDVPLGSYLVEVKSSGYIIQTTMVVLEKDKALEKNFELVKAGMIITLKGVFFETGKATLKPEAYSALQEAGKILTDNPKIRVEIQGHTDNVGSVAYNQTLSEKRAYAVMNYLVTNLGITPERLIAKGYGSSKPIASNTTEQGRALNRRVDFVIKEI